MLENKLKAQNSKLKTKIQNFPAKAVSHHKLNIGWEKFLVLSFSFAFCVLRFALACFAQDEFIYDSKGKRNPFIPLVTFDGRLLKLDKEVAKDDEDLLIEGIIYDKQGRSFAIVNGSVVGIGDIVADYRVLKIEDKKVTFIKEGLTREVEIKKEAQ